MSHLSDMIFLLLLMTQMTHAKTINVHMCDISEDRCVHIIIRNKAINPNDLYDSVDMQHNH